MKLAGLVLVAALVVGGTATAQSCPSARILEGVWQASFSAVEQATAAAQRGEKVDLARLEYHVSTLGTISGLEADITYFGYLPDENLRLMMRRWREWYSGRSCQLCAALPPANGGKKGAEGGCAGQQRLARLWLANTRSMERTLQDLESDRSISRDELEELIGFFGRVTGLAASVETRLPMAIDARLKLMVLVEKWQDWFVNQIGTMCSR